MVRFDYGLADSNSFPGPEIGLMAESTTEPSLLSEEVRGILDTGADKTCLPLRLIEQLDPNTLECSFVCVNGPFGKVEQRYTFFVNIILNNCRFDNIEIIPIERDYALIGRDILNRYRIVLDGPNRNWEVDSTCQ